MQQMRTIALCEKALTLSLTEGITESEAVKKVGTTFASLYTYKNTEEGKRFIELLKEKSREKLLNQVQSNSNSNLTI